MARDDFLQTGAPAQGRHEPEGTDMIERVPVVDLAAIDQGPALEAIDRACREWGCFQVVGHDIERSLIDSLFAVGHEFFAQPRELKRRIERDAHNRWGYFDRGQAMDTPDRDEIFDFGPADGGHLKPRWPSGRLRLRFEPTVRAHYASCMALALRLLSAIAANLGTSPAALTRHFESGHSSFLRLSRHPARSAGGADTPLEVGERTDPGALTVLLQDDRPALEVWHGGRWHVVQPLPGALAISLGDMVQVWSNDRYVAAPQRVPGHAARERFSVPFFLNPSHGTVVAPLPCAVTPQRPPRYRPIAWRELRTLRTAGEHA